MAEKMNITIEQECSSDEVAGHTAITLCQSCSIQNIQTAADVYCQICDEFQCKECSKIHKKYRYMKSHKLIGTQEAKSKPTPFEMKGLDQCQQHHELLEFFCEDENLLCCSTCVIVNHRKCHNVEEVQKIVEKKSLTSSEIKNMYQEIKSKADMVVNHNMQSSILQLDHKAQEIPLQIKRMRDYVMKMFDDSDKFVSKEIESFWKITYDKLITRQQHCQKQASDATESLTTIENVYLDGTHSQQFIVEHNMKKHAEKLRMNVEEECLNIKCIDMSFEFDELLKLRPPFSSDYIPGKLTLKCSMPEALKLTKIMSIDLKQTGNDIKLPLYTGLDFLSDGRLVAVDNINKKCLVYNEKLEKVGSYQLPYRPQSVFVVADDEVAITSPGDYKIDFLHVSKSNKISLARTCKVTTEYASISMKDDESFVVGTVDNTRPVRIVSLAGEEKDFNFSFPDKKYPVGTSTCIYLRGSDKVVLTDRNEHTVYIYDIATNSSVVVKNDQIKVPCGVAVGPADCILVCSNNTDSVVHISPTGRVVSSYKLDTKSPYRVCVSKDESLLAISTICVGKKKLILYKLQVNIFFLLYNR